MSKKPILRFALAVLCIVGSFTIWGVLGTALRKEPASVPQTGTTVQSAKDRNVILYEATGVSKKVKDGKEQNVLLYDPFIGEKWGLVRTNSHKAWEVSQGSKDIVVAVIDTGTDVHHKCLQDNLWVNKAEVDSGKRPGVSSEMAERMKALERENRELRQANEILRKASAYFAMAEFDRRSK